MLSVVVPTYRRPQFLSCAIKSALQFAPEGDVEVIVVPNGLDESWRTVAKFFKHDQRVQWHPIKNAHANAARNVGKRRAHGKYLRFLDDDDYLLAGAVRQIELAESESYEVCSAPVDMIASDGRLIKKMKLASTDDFVSALLSPQRQTGFQFHLYLRSSISDFWHDESVDIGQDTDWVHRLCRSRDWRWGKVDESGCTWRHHSSSQISSAFGAAGHLELQEEFLWETIEHLLLNDRLVDERPRSAARGVWSLVHAGFFMNPGHWYRVIRKLVNLFPNTYPEVAIYNSYLGRFIPPVLLESFMLPKRWLNHSRRAWLVKQGKKNFWEF